VKISRGNVKYSERESEGRRITEEIEAEEETFSDYARAMLRKSKKKSVQKTHAKRPEKLFLNLQGKKHGSEEKGSADSPFHEHTFHS